MREIKKNFIVPIFVIAIAAVLCVCIPKFRSDENKIKSRIECFLKAYNSGDLEKMLDCMDSKTKNTYKSAKNVSNALIGGLGTDVDLSDIFGLSIAYLSDGNILTVNNMRIKMLSEDSAEVYTDMSYHDKTEDKSGEVCIVMVKEDYDWFINDMK